MPPGRSSTGLPSHAIICARGSARPTKRRSAGLQPSDATFVERLGLPVRKHAERLLQRVAQMGIPAQRRGTVAGRELALHQRTVGRLVGRLELHEPVPLGAGAQQLDVAGVQALACELRPRLVACAGKQVAGVGGAALGAFGGVAAGQRGLRLARESFGVDITGRSGHSVTSPPCTTTASWRPSAWRAWCTALRRLAAPASGSSCGHSASITCSRVIRCRGCRLSSCTRCCARRLGQRSTGSSLPRMVTAKRPRR